MCEFCNFDLRAYKALERKTIHFGLAGTCTLEIGISGDTMQGNYKIGAYLDNSEGGCEDVGIPMSFCPICGRKLESEISKTNKSDNQMALSELSHKEICEAYSFNDLVKLCIEQEGKIASMEGK
jgi:hypothetical protein